MSGLDSGLDSPLTPPIIIYRPNGERVQNGANVVVNVVKPESKASPKRVQTTGSGSKNGAIVPINIKTNLKNVESIMLFVENNPQPLSSGYNLTPKSVPSIGTRIKMGKTSKVIAAVKSNGKIYSAQKEVKVTIGGCGG